MIFYTLKVSLYSPRPLNHLRMGVFPLVESLFNSRPIKDIVFIIIRSVNQISCIV